jgi:hypothetical protein
VKIVILENMQFAMVSGQFPQIGMKYVLEEAESATGEQNRLFHALVSEYWSSGMSSHKATDFDAFRDEIKLKLGAGFEKIVYATVEDGKPVIVQVKRLDEVPPHVLKDPDLKKMVLAKLKSWSAYTKKERTQTIDRLIAEMHQAGVNTKHFQEIMSGIADNANQGAQR